ncbi:hypothetical protein, partial [Xanthomonas hortorum]|uniref:hypothetical protein n=1 Tax=Xanthomonas hortorum TaxID=56454 RepID=UPI001E530A9A
MANSCSVFHAARSGPAFATSSSGFVDKNGLTEESVGPLYFSEVSISKENSNLGSVRVSNLDNRQLAIQFVSLTIDSASAVKTRPNSA